MFATLVSRSMPHSRRAPLPDVTRVREATRESRGGRSQQTCRARATSNQALVDVIIVRKRAPSHRVFVAQVFRRNMWAKQRRRHRFSAFWLRSKCSIPHVSSIARSELWSAVRFAARDNPSPSLTRDFLSGSTNSKLHPNRIRYRTHSLQICMFFSPSANPGSCIPKVVKSA
jgi:hypothetical protein